MLIYTINDCLVVSADSIIQKGEIALTSLPDKKTKLFKLEKSMYKKIVLDNPGKYKVTVTCDNEKVSKIIYT